MNTFLYRFFLILSIGLLSQTIFAVQDRVEGQQPNFNVPQEILDRLPEEQVAPFLMGRQKILLKFQGKNSEQLDVYNEINVTRNAIARMPDDQLFQFFVDMKYIEAAPEEHIMNQHHGGSSPPSPEQLIQLLFWLVGGALLVILISIYLAHQRRMGEQEVVLRALEVGEEIPLAIFEVRRQKAFIRWGVLLCTTAAAITGYGIFNQMSIGLAVIPGSIGIGFLLAGLIVKD